MSSSLAPVLVNLPWLGPGLRNKRELTSKTICLSMSTTPYPES